MKTSCKQSPFDVEINSELSAAETGGLLGGVFFLLVEAVDRDGGVPTKRSNGNGPVSLNLYQRVSRPSQPAMAISSSPVDASNFDSVAGPFRHRGAATMELIGEVLKQQGPPLPCVILQRRWWQALIPLFPA
nr:hypothetical protein Iba_chr05bCG7210 [Ipomoea batatas]